MSTSHSIRSIDSTSSSNTMSNHRLNEQQEQQLDPSNILYNDHQNYQIIFTNDSRFFDTSLHLFQSYRQSGYIQSENKKAKRNPFSSSIHIFKPPSNGHLPNGRSKSAGFQTNPEVDGYNNATLKPTTSRYNDPSNHPSPKVRLPSRKPENPYRDVSYPRQRPLSNHNDNHGDSSDDPDIIVTRL